MHQKPTAPRNGETTVLYYSSGRCVLFGRRNDQRQLLQLTLPQGRGHASLQRRTQPLLPSNPSPALETISLLLRVDWASSLAISTLSPDAYRVSGACLLHHMPWASSTPRSTRWHEGLVIFFAEGSFCSRGCCRVGSWQQHSVRSFLPMTV